MRRKEVYLDCLSSSNEGKNHIGTGILETGKTKEELCLPEDMSFIC